MAQTEGSVNEDGANRQVRAAELDLDRDVFMRSLVRELASVLEETVGLDDASGFISIVGDRIGHDINSGYKQALAADSLSREQVAEVLVDLKRRIEGDFYVIEQSDEKIVFGNRACPFAEKVIGHPSMCMMTSNVFGSIAAENLGYAKVELQETIAEGAPGCRVVVHLEPTAKVRDLDGREYFQTREL